MKLGRRAFFAAIAAAIAGAKSNAGRVYVWKARSVGPTTFMQVWLQRSPWGWWKCYPCKAGGPVPAVCPGVFTCPKCGGGTSQIARGEYRYADI